MGRTTMDPVIETEAPKAETTVSVVPAANDIGRVLQETRAQFVNAFSSQCDTIGHSAGAAADSTASALAINVLHRMAGLAGTIGFPQVSIKAAALEDGLRASSLDADQVRAGVTDLRAAFADDAAHPQGATTAPAAAPLAGTAMKILVVEDEPFQRAVIVAQLRKAGHTAVEVAKGEDVLPAARTVRPDVILLDVELPGINGYTVCRMLKADPALAAIPVAFLSAHTNVDDRLMGLSHGADDFLTKPLDPRELALRIQLLAKHGQRTDDKTTRGVLSYEAFRDEAERELRRERTALALIRTPADRAPDVAAFTREEIRRRDLCGHYDRSHVVVLLPDTGAAAAKERVSSIVESCRAKGISGVYAGIAAAPVAGGRTLEELIEEADEALAVARYEGVSAALRPDGIRHDGVVNEVMPMVVVGDDDPDVVRIVDAHLASEGYRRVLAFDGTRTLEEVRAQRPEVLVLDLMMPRMTGFDVLAGLRDMGEARPRVIVLSARGREEDVIRAFALGADDFVAKPFNPHELLARIARLVK